MKIIPFGDRRLCAVLKRAFELGCSFDSWSEHFNEEAWKQALSEFGIDRSYHALSGSEPGSALPWNIIDSGISESFLQSEWIRASQAVTTKDCRYGCNGCGINEYTDCPCGGIYG